MELELRGRRDLGNAVFNAYLDHAAEAEGLRALPLFLALRAATRAYALAGSAARQPAARAAEAQAAAARRHIVAAFGFLDPPPPRFVALGGGDAARRETLAGPLAARAAPAPGARLLRAGAAAWEAAEAALAAGCSVLVEGDFDAAGAGRAATALAARYPHLLLWLGDPPDPAWHGLDPAADAPALRARAATLLEPAGPPPSASIREACP
jgi:hypothetical protein